MAWLAQRKIPTGKHPIFTCRVCGEAFESIARNRTAPSICSKPCYLKTFANYTPDPTKKTCPRCKETKPRATDFYFNSKGQISSNCRPCTTAYSAELRRRNSKHKEQRKAYYQANKTAILAKSKAYFQAHPEVSKKASEKWAANNKERCRERVRRRRNLKRGNGGSYTVSEWKELCERAANRCLDCGKLKPLSVDHVIPVSKGGTSDISNLQPLCVSCNSRKRDKDGDFRDRLVYVDMLQMLKGVYQDAI